MEVPPLRKLLYMRLGDLDNARQWFEKAADLVEKTGHEAGARWLQRARIWNALGTVARSDGRDPKALEAVSLDGSSKKSLGGLDRDTSIRLSKYLNSKSASGSE